MTRQIDWTMEPASAENPLTPVPMQAGDLVYLDCFSGTVPCKIERIYQETEYPSGITYTYVRAVVTATHKGYSKGESVVSLWDRFCPRKSRVLRGYEYRIRTNYHPVVSG